MSPNEQIPTRLPLHTLQPEGQIRKRVNVAELVESVRLELGMSFTRSALGKHPPAENTATRSKPVYHEVEDAEIDATALLTSMNRISSNDKFDDRTPKEQRPGEVDFQQKEATVAPLDKDNEAISEQRDENPEDDVSDDIFEKNRKQLFNPPEKSENNLIRASVIVITLALLFLFGYYAYTGGYFNSYLPDYLKYKQAPLRDRMNEQQLIDHSSLHFPRQQVFSPINMESVS